MLAVPADNLLPTVSYADHLARWNARASLPRQFRRPERAERHRAPPSPTSGSRWIDGTGSLRASVWETVCPPAWRPIRSRRASSPACLCCAAGSRLDWPGSATPAPPTA